MAPWHHTQHMPSHGVERATLAAGQGRLRTSQKPHFLHRRSSPGDSGVPLHPAQQRLRHDQSRLPFHKHRTRVSAWVTMQVCSVLL